MDDELERFKREISIVEVAIGYGFQLSEKESSAKSLVMRNGAKGAGEKIRIGSVGGHNIYKNFSEPDDKGTVIDFVKHREPSLNFGQVRKLLRSHLAGGVQYPSNTAVRPIPSRMPLASTQVVMTLEEIRTEWEQLPIYTGRYLSSRGLKVDLIQSFGVRQDARTNACFPHFDEGVLTGWEVKNKFFTGFKSDSTKSLVVLSNDDLAVERIVITEASIDALSYAQLKHTPGSLYVSTGGAMSPRQHELVTLLLQKHSGATIVCAHDADDAGDKMSADIERIAPPGAKVVRDRPIVSGDDKDWNDVLKVSNQSHAERSTVIKSGTSYPRRHHG